MMSVLRQLPIKVAYKKITGKRYGPDI